MRIATYNLFEGASGSYNRLVVFAREAKLDVLCLQEVNGWQDNDFARLRDFTDQILFAAYAYGNSNTEYKLATVSKYAIIKQTLHAEAFWHAALEVRLQVGGGQDGAAQEVSIFNIHLDPWQESSRDKEIARLLATVDPARPTIITGDFNSLSRQDNYPPALLTELQSRGISKFGTSALEFTVIDRLLQAGFVDVAAAAGTFETTVPSAFNTDKNHEVPVRVDYMFVSPALVPLVKQVEVIKSDLTDAVSDHYPLVVTFQFGDGDDEPPAPTTPAAPPSPAPKPAPTPWVPDEPTRAPEPPKPADGEVVVWTHNKNDRQNSN